MARAGMDRMTGRLLTGWEHCAQSIVGVLETEIGTRTMRRLFGSALHDIQDRNPDGRTLMTGFVSIAAALRQWEPGFKLMKIIPGTFGADGVATFTLSGVFYPRGHLGDYSVAEHRDVALANDTLRVWRGA